MHLPEANLPVTRSLSTRMARWGLVIVGIYLLVALITPFLVCAGAVSYTHLRAHETLRYHVCRLLLEKKK